jgi:hypothetical protein
MHKSKHHVQQKDYSQKIQFFHGRNMLNYTQKHDNGASLTTYLRTKVAKDSRTFLFIDEQHPEKRSKICAIAHHI